MTNYLSQALSIQLAIIKRLRINTNKTVPGQMVIRVLRTNLVLKLILFRAPILRLDASVKSFECKSMERQIKYKRKNMGNERNKSTGMTALFSSGAVVALVTQENLKSPGIGWIKQMITSTVISVIRFRVIEMRQSSTQLSIINN